MGVCVFVCVYVCLYVCVCVWKDRQKVWKNKKKSGPSDSTGFSLLLPSNNTLFPILLVLSTALKHNAEQSEFDKMQEILIHSHTYISFLIFKDPLRTDHGCLQWVEINKPMREVDQCKMKGHIERTKRILWTFLRCLWNNGGYIPSHSTSCFIGLACHSFFSFFLFPGLLERCPPGSSSAATCPGAVVALATSPNSVPSSQRCHKKCKVLRFHFTD